MTNKAKIGLLQARYNLLMARGPHNYKLCQKLLRKIRKLNNEPA